MCASSSAIQWWPAPSCSRARPASLGGAARCRIRAGPGAVAARQPGADRDRRVSAARCRAVESRRLRRTARGRVAPAPQRPGCPGGGPRCDMARPLGVAARGDADQALGVLPPSAGRCIAAIFRRVVAARAAAAAASRRAGLSRGRGRRRPRLDRRFLRARHRPRVSRRVGEHVPGTRPGARHIAPDVRARLRTDRNRAARGRCGGGRAALAWRRGRRACGAVDPPDGSDRGAARHPAAAVARAGGHSQPGARCFEARAAGFAARVRA